MANQNNDIIIELKGISKRYGFGDAESYALRNFSLSVKRGEFIMIMGPTGCGKTTLLNIIGLLDQPSSGEYILAGKELLCFIGGISIVYQNLFNTLSYEYPKSPNFLIISS